jgi:hypothetical protein
MSLGVSCHLISRHSRLEDDEEEEKEEVEEEGKDIDEFESEEESEPKQVALTNTINTTNIEFLHSSLRISWFSFRKLHYE